MSLDAVPFHIMLAANDRTKSPAFTLIAEDPKPGHLFGEVRMGIRGGWGEKEETGRKGASAPGMPRLRHPPAARRDG